MTSITIKAKTNKGKLALEQHMKETIRMNRKNKAIRKLLRISQEVTSEVPFSIKINIGDKALSSILEPTHLINEVDKFMVSVGAKKNKDYTTEVS